MTFYESDLLVSWRVSGAQLRLHAHTLRARLVLGAQMAAARPGSHSFPSGCLEFSSWPHSLISQQPVRQGVVSIGAGRRPVGELHSCLLRGGGERCSHRIDDRHSTEVLKKLTGMMIAFAC